MIQFWENLVMDGRTDGRTDDKSDFIGRCTTNAELPKVILKKGWFSYVGVT